jgi:hypothetical protein
VTDIEIDLCICVIDMWVLYIESDGRWVRGDNIKSNLKNGLYSTCIKQSPVAAAWMYGAGKNIESCKRGSSPLLPAAVSHNHSFP